MKKNTKWQKDMSGMIPLNKVSKHVKWYSVLFMDIYRTQEVNG